MDKPENYYAILGVVPDASSDTLKRAYRQLARRFHPDLAGATGAIEMKRINRAYAVLSDPEKRQSYDTILGGVVDLRQQGFVRPRPHPRASGDSTEDADFDGMRIFSTQGPLHTGPVINSTLGVITALHSQRTVYGLVIAASSLDGKGMLWQIVNNTIEEVTHISSDPSFTIESLRELRFSAAGALVAGWGRLGLHVWDAYNGALLWSYPLTERAVSAHYSLDIALQVTADGRRLAYVALPHLPEDTRSPRAWGVRGSDVAHHEMGSPPAALQDTLVCIEDGLERRQFWAIRMRALAQDTHSLLTLSCAQVPHEQEQMAIVRRWDLTARTRMGGKIHPQIASAMLAGRCEDCTPPYAVTPDARIVAFVYAGKNIRLCDTITNTYSEFASGAMGGSSKLALSPDAQWLAVAREDSEINEGVIDLWSTTTGQIVQKFYHPWQISALHFAEKQLVVALTDGTIQLWS